MIKAIFLKEIKLILSSNRFIISFVTIVLLFTLNAFMYNSFFEREKYFSNELSNNREWLLERRELNPWLLLFQSPAENILNRDSLQLIEVTFGYQKLIKPLSEISFISQTNYTVIPNGININYFSFTNPKKLNSNEGFIQNLQAIDWNFILLFIVSFVIIVVTYESVSGEKFNGTLKVILTNKISRAELLIGKYFSILFVVLLPVIIGILLNIVIVSMHSEILLQSIDFLKILMYIIAIILYISIQILICLFISIVTAKPSVSLAINLMVWVILIIIIPGIGWIFAKEKVKISSLEETNSIDNSYQNPRWEYGWELKPPSKHVYEYAKEINKRTEYHNQLWKDYNNQLFKQTELAYKMSKISPSMIFQYIGEAISDNGLVGYLNFYNQALSYQETLREYVKQVDYLDNSSSHLIWNNIHTTKHFMSEKSCLISDIPKFKYHQPSINFVLAFIKIDLLTLIIWNILLTIIVFVFFFKHDVR
ncbi:MAG: ABC transporter permease [Draconibacterium sp.]